MIQAGARAASTAPVPQHHPPTLGTHRPPHPHIPRQALTQLDQPTAMAAYSQPINMAELGQKTQHATQQAMETFQAGAAEVGRVSRRLMRSIWDPEPTNDRAINRPVWCLGCSYTYSPATVADSPAHTERSATTRTDDARALPPTPTLNTPPESSTSSFSSSLAYDEPPDDGGWPAAFLQDFESRIWMTYRSTFPPIARSADPNAVTTLSFAMRLKALADPQGGFSSDSGWGCMIRSGQSLLANALIIHQLGRGELSLKCRARFISQASTNQRLQTGVEEQLWNKSERF